MTKDDWNGAENVVMLIVTGIIVIMITYKQLFIGGSLW